MNTELAFRLGYAERLAERGVAPEALSDALEQRFYMENVKAAETSAIKGKLFGLLPQAGKAMWDVSRGTFWLGAFAPAVLAGIVGYTLAGSKRVSKPDIAAQRDMMMIGEIEEQRRRLADRAAMRRQEGAL